MQKIIIRDEPLRARAIGLLSALDLSKPWELSIVRAKSKRSLAQNRLLWEWLGMIATDTGNTPSDVHEWCKSEFLPPVFVTVNGKTKQVRRSTTDLKVDEMTEYLERICAWAASELGISLPTSEDMGRE